MLQAERLNSIRKYVDTVGYAELNNLVKEFGISKATARRDLQRLMSENVIELTRGGAVSVQKKGSLYEDAYSIKSEHNKEEKQRIAKAACEMLKERHSVFLDSSTTVREMVPEIKKIDFEIVIATNDIMIASDLIEAENITVNVVGGTLRKGYYTLTGVFAETILRELSLDVAFMSCDSANLTNGFSLTNVEEVQLKRMIVDAADNAVMLCDSSKFEKSSFMQMFDISAPSKIITGKELHDDIYNMYLERGVDIIRA